MSLSPDQFLDLTPREINWKIQAWNDKKEKDNWDIINLANWVSLGVNDRKTFVQEMKKQMPHKIQQNEDDEMRRQAAGIGQRVPSR